MTLAESGNMIEVIECPGNGTENEDKIEVMKYLCKEDKAKVIFIRKFSEDGGCGTTHGVSEINRITEIDEHCQSVDGDEQPAACFLINGCLFTVPRQEHKHDIKTVGDEDCRRVEYQSA
jgi:hypothetical protein